MSYKVFFTSKASNDLREIRDWYEQDSELVSDEFFEHLEIALEQIAQNPHRFAPVQEDVRRTLLKRFPYKIVFVADEPNMLINVIAVVHTARSPKTWKRRI